MKTKGNDWLEQNRKQLCFALIAVFIWGLAAHGYGFLNNSFSHDSLTEFDGADWSNTWKIKLGRFVIPFYRAVFRTELTLPWLIGLLSLLWIGLAVFLVGKLFKMESKALVFATAGIFTVNLTAAATASTYLHDFDCDMFALLCAVGAVSCWDSGNIRNLLPGAALVALSLGIYQSFLSVTIVLVMFISIFALFDGETFRNVLLRGMKAIGMLLLGCVVYYLMMQLVLAATGISLSSGGTNSLDQALKLTPYSLLRLTVYAYFDCAAWLWNPFSVYPELVANGITVLLLAVTAACAVVGLCRKQMGWLEKLLCLVLFGLLPLGMNLMYVLTGGAVHYLMVYAVWLFYLLSLLMARWLGEQTKKLKWLDWGTLLLVFLLMYGNVQTANALYLKKDMEQDAFHSMMTRIVYRMEDCDGYVSGETPVVFVGRPEQLQEAMPGFEKYTGITGQHQVETADTRIEYRIRRYFRYILGAKDVMAEEAVWNAMQNDPRVTAMPRYPQDGCTAILDGVLVVKLGENE